MSHPRAAFAQGWEKRPTIVFVLIALLTCFSHLTFAQADPPSATALYRDLSSVRLDPDRVFRVRDLTVQVHEIQFTFNDGVIIFSAPVSGEITGAYFEGDGEVLVLPPDLVERQSLALFTGSAVLEERFSVGFFRFRGGEMAQLAERLRVPVAATQVFTKGDLVMHSLAGIDALPLLDDSLNRPQETKQTGFLHARVQGLHLGNFDINFDADEPEQITIGRANEDSGKRLYDIWTRFSSHTAPQQTDPVAISDYKIVSQVTPPTEVAAEVTVKLRARVAGIRCVIFELSRNLKIKSVNLVAQEPAPSEVEGSPAVRAGEAPAPPASLEFIQNESLEGSELARRGNDFAAVIFPAPLALDKETELRFSYAGPVLSDAGNGLLYVGARGTWYPNRGPAMANFDMRFRHPELWSLVASGRHISSGGIGSQGGIQSYSEWKTDSPVPVAGFNLGRYEGVSSLAGETSVEVYAARGMENVQAPTTPGEKGKNVPRQRGALAADPTRNLKRIAEDSARDIESLSARLGPFPFHNLEITQMPGEISQGWPGLIYLSSYAFLSGNERAAGPGSYGELLYDRLMLAHEIAHQWWGDQVMWAGPRDAWLIEALANYSALQALAETNPQDLRTALDYYQGSLLSTNKDGKTLADAGPVTIGFRLSSSKFPTGYEEVAYGRGTWLIHMLREMLREPGSRDPDARFRAGLLELLENGRGKTISNLDVQHAFEKRLPPAARYEGKASLEWFFEGWVNGSAVPSFTLKNVHSRSTRITAKFTGIVAENDAPERLVTSLPIYAESPAPEKPPVYLGRVFVDEPQTEFSLAAPAGTRKLLLDPYHTVLRK